MQIFSPLPIAYSSSRRRRSLSSGFTLIELLISFLIITIISTIVLLKHRSFNSSVLLKNTAYEIALNLRDAQVKSVSAARSGDGIESFNFPYGVTFDVSSPVEQKQYRVFRYKSATAGPYYDISESDPDVAEVIQTFTIGRTMRVKELCYTYASLPDKCDLTRLDISFRRPEFKSIFYGVIVDDFVATSSVTGVKIKVNSLNNTAQFFMVEVNQFGQISVK